MPLKRSCLSIINNGVCNVTVSILVCETGRAGSTPVIHPKFNVRVTREAREQIATLFYVGSNPITYSIFNAPVR